jgi:RNA polymerase subunit RPABC4/transcription elongation factor Spt4
MEGYIILWLLCGIVGAMIGSRKGAGCAGFLLGIFLGPIGIIISIVMKGNRKSCPYCKELVQAEALKCPKCGAALTSSKHVSAETVSTWVKKCPQCAESIRKEALICRFCHHHFDKKDVILELVGALKGDIQTRFLAIESIETIGDQTDAIHLLNAIVSAERDFTSPADFAPLQDRGKRALLKIGTLSVLPELQSIVAGHRGIREDQDGRVVLICIELLGYSRDPSSVPVLIDSLKHRSTRPYAIAAIIKIGTPALPLLKKAAVTDEGKVRKAANRILKKMGAR